MNKEKEIYRPECRHFIGYIPCKPHKDYGVHCFKCDYYEPKKDKILIIKLGAIGDVIRTTPLLHRLWAEYPDSEIWQLTYSPEALPKDIDRILKFTPENLLTISQTEFSIVINLDKDPHACALTNSLKAEKKIGFMLENGKPAPISGREKHKFITGLFDDVNQENTKSYPEEIFEIMGWEFNGEEYLLNFDSSIEWNIPNGGKPIVGLNTGCGERRPSRLWASANWIELINALQGEGYFPMLLGGKQEDEKNSYFASETRAYYPGHFSLQEFISLMNQCSTVVTAVTMGLHIAVGLKKNVVLMNNIFNPHEFDLYGRGEIVQPEKKCTCFFRPKCINEEYFCMDHLKPGTILESVKKFTPIK